MTNTTVLTNEYPRPTGTIGVHYPLLLDNPFEHSRAVMFNLMLRNVATDGYVFADPWAPRFSQPGCIIASPSYDKNTPNIDQDYIYHWTRDAAMTAYEMANAPLPFNDPAFIQQYLDNYVTFSKICQDNTSVPLDHACFNINGTPRDWGNQSDGPASQTLAILAAYSQLSAGIQPVAVAVISANLAFLLNNKYQLPTVNLWEETSGLSFYARATQLRCFNAVSNALVAGTPPSILPPGKTAGDIDAAKNWLTSALRSHWVASGNGSFYQSIMQASGRGAGLNADVVMAAVYGDVPDGISDNKLLATAAQVRNCWKDAPINKDDAHGPMIGRYPNDSYVGGNSWLLCTANFAEFYYRLANAISTNNALFQVDPYNRPFYAQVGVGESTSVADAISALRNVGDRMLKGVLYHSDHLELSEQIRWDNGYEVSVRDLTWSYAAFLSAVRAR